MSESKPDIAVPLSDTVKVELPPVSKPIKKITITCRNGKRWDAEFEGTITRRDINKVERLLKVDYARIQRRRSTARIVKQHQTATRKLATEELAKSTEQKDTPNA